MPRRMQQRFLESLLHVERLAALWNGGKLRREWKGARLQTLVALARVR